MPLNVVTGQMLSCTFGVAPSTLVVLPLARVMIEGRPAATIQDSAPMVNIPPFGMCISTTNPTVVAATAAALGVLTPMPCVPSTVGPWTPAAPTTMIGGKPALAAGAMLMCAFGGQISMVGPSAVRTQSK